MAETEVTLMALSPKKKRTAIALITVGAALILLGLYILISSGDDAPVTSGDDLLVIFEHSAYTTSHIDYTVRGQEAVSFDYVSRAWQYTDDPKFPLNVAYPRQMASAISKIAAIKLVESTRENFATYGLDNPYIEINVAYSDGVSSSFIIGDYNSYSGGHYFNIKGTDDVYMIASGLAPFFEYTIYDMIVPDIETVDISTAKSVEVTLDGEVKSFDSKISTDLTAAAVALTPKCIDYKPTEKLLSECGFDSPSGRIALNYTVVYSVESDNPDIISSANVGVDKSLVFILGNTDGEGNIYLTAESSDRLYTIPLADAERIISLAKAEL